MLDTILFELEPENHFHLSSLLGDMNRNLKAIEDKFQVEVSNRSFAFQITGEKKNVNQAKVVILDIYAKLFNELDADFDINFFLHNDNNKYLNRENTTISIKTKRGLISGRGINQQKYLQRIYSNAVNFGIGPAGTGKTFLAVAAAIGFLDADKVKRIILVRPAIEAGEKLGFLPGDMSQKVDPYLRPLYDALNDMMGIDKVARLIERGVIEIAPLAFMRGRTLNDAFIILDEAQNATVEQMKMFLTRLGFNSTAVITGDPSQIDLPKNIISGLKNAAIVLKDVDGISFTKFNPEDVVRHPLVQKIITAYENSEE